MMYDVIVVGLGPGGSTVAYELAVKGLRVLAFDRERFPRYKPCGGCISLKVKKVLPFDFKEVVEDTVYGAILTFKSKRPLPIISESPVCYNVMRDRFDNLLKKKAENAGATVREGEKVIGVEELSDFVNITTSRDSYQARVLVGADGVNGFVAREALGLVAKVCGVAIEAELPFDGEKLSDLKRKLFINFGCIPHGYGWIFPKANHLSVGIAGVSTKVKGRIREYFKDFIRREKLLQGLEISDIHGWTLPYFYDSGQKIAQGRVVLVGDAAQLVDPFLGEGIYYAIRSGQIAAEIISEKIGDATVDLSPYSGIIKIELYPELIAAAKVARLVYNFPRLWHRIVEAEPSLMERYFDVIRGDESYERFYSYLISRIKTRPWRFIGKWLKGYF